MPAPSTSLPQPESPHMPKTTLPADFRVPSLADASPEYGELQRRLATLDTAHAALTREARTLQKDIAASPTPRVRPGVAALIGDDPVDGGAAKVAKLADLQRSIADHDAALAEVRRRLIVARGPASTAARAAVKPEYQRRVRAVCEALVAAEEARAAYEDMRSQFEAEDIEWTGLGVLALGFLGDRDGGKSFHIQRVLREAREAGNYA